MLAIPLTGCATADTAPEDGRAQASVTIDAERTTQSATGSIPSSRDVAAVLGAVAANRVFEDNSFGGQAVFERVNIVDTLGTDDGDAFLEPDSTSPIGAEARAAIEAALAPIEVTWVPRLLDVIGDVDAPSHLSVGAVLTLGVPSIAGTEATATSNLWCGDLCAIGGAHTLERSPSGTWAVTGVTGSQWVS